MNETTKALLAGALVPTVAYLLLRNNLDNNVLSRIGFGAVQSKNVTTKGDDDNNNNDDDCDDDESSGQLSLDDDDEDDNPPTTGSTLCRDWGMKDAPYKMVLCVNTDLAMGKGKIAAQCCHAAVGCYKRAVKNCPGAIRAWEYTGCAKIAVKCPSIDEMLLIAAKAKSLDIPFYLVEDAGRTQIAPGSKTVLGLFGPVHVFEGVTDHLKLM